MRRYKECECINILMVQFTGNEKLISCTFVIHRCQGTSVHAPRSAKRFKGQGRWELSACARNGECVGVSVRDG